MLYDFISLFSLYIAYKPAVTIHLAKETKIDYKCPVCFEPLTEGPFLLIECGHHLCRLCRDRLLRMNKTECPKCREPDQLKSAVPDRNIQRLVRSLEVRCSEYQEGCKWVGELRYLHDHLKKQCDIAFLQCPFCSYRSLRSEMKEHTRHCPQRMISCENCGYYNTFTIVTEKHYPVCPKSSRLIISRTSVPQQYQYNQASIEFIINDFSEKREEWCSPPFYTHDRGYKFCLEVLPNGYSTGSGSHISMYAYLLKGMFDEELRWPFEGDIIVELLDWDSGESSLCHTIHYNSYHDRDGTHSSRAADRLAANGLGIPQFISRADLMVSNNDSKFLCNDCLRLRVNAIVYSTPFLCPIPARQVTPCSDSTSTWHKSSFTSTRSGVQFTISEYSKRKQFNNEYFSQPFTSSPQGYTFCLRIFANGDGSGKGSHLSIFAYIMKGQHDDHLWWPFTGTISFELFNWLGDKRHYKRTLSIDADDNFTKVTQGEYGKNLGYHQFISQSYLQSADAQYIKHDCIHVKVNIRLSD